MVLSVIATVAAAPARGGKIVRLTGSDLAGFNTVPIERLGVLACTGDSCAPVPFQVDERDAQGRWVLDHGPEQNQDDPPNVIDDNDVLLLAAEDAGERALPTHLPAARAIAEIRLHDPLSAVDRFVYLCAFDAPAPRSTVTYVDYDRSHDRVRGSHVSLGFADGVPAYLAIDDGPNLLDRLKVRASATFLFGLIHFSRSEADLRTEFMGWHEGPIRIIRAQRQWVRLGWGIHSPTFGSYTYFYRDSAELPVGLRLNFPPTYFFGNIVVRVILDFRDLRNWSLLVPSVREPIPLDGQMTPVKAQLNQGSDPWFALRGPQVTLLQTMDLSPSLATVRQRFLLREQRTPAPPESVPGEEPGIGWQLDQWEHVGAGAHQLSAVSYALPAAADVHQFMQVQNRPLEVSVHELPSTIHPSTGSGQAQHD